MKETLVKILAEETKMPLEQISKLIETPPSFQLGDFAFPCFTLSKTFKKSPQEIAQALAKKIKSKEFEKVEPKGAYVNFFLDRRKLAKKTLELIKREKEKYGAQKIKSKVLIESPGPNTNKPLHIGHARNIILAQSIKKILEFSDNTVRMVNINNDRGTHICKSLIAYNKFGKNSTPEKSKRKSDFFVGDFYVKYNEELKKNPKLENEVQQCLKKWEEGDKKTLALWKKMNDWAYKGFKETYKKFDLKIDNEYYESKIYKKGRDIVLEQFKKGNVIKKDKAFVIDLGNKWGEKVLLRSDGTSIYITQDIFLAIKRKKDLKFDKMIYVVANEQNYHFEVLFELLRLFGYKWAKDLEHLNYGLVHLESGRMKSREGKIIDSDDLISELESLSLKELNRRYPKLSKREKEKRTKTITMAALRYYFLKIERTKDLVFKPEESISFEGNTGPYLLYTYARAKSILRKAKQRKKLEIKEINESEKNLILQLNSFPQIVEKTHTTLAPNLIANYTYQLAQTFNEFYHSTKVINSKNESFRLFLVEAVAQVLKNALDLLHIETLETM